MLSQKHNSFKGRKNFLPFADSSSDTAAFPSLVGKVGY